MNTSAIFGFLLTLEEVLTKQNPSHIAVVFDPPGPTFRNDIYPAYKANRDATPEDIKESVPWIKQLLKAYRIEVIEIPEYEADDVIGTLAVKAAAGGFTTYMMTPDKDFGQLVTGNTFMYRPGRSGKEAEIWGREEIIREFGVPPEHITDLLGLMGDSSDNIPGAPGIGPKGASKLINAHGTIENLLDDTSVLSGRQKEIIEQNREIIILSKKLATINKKAPADFSEERCLRRDADIQALRKIYGELEFRTLLSRLPAEAEERKSGSLTADRPARENDSRSPEAISHSPKVDSHSPKVDSHSPKVDSHSPEADSHSPKVDSHSPEADSRSPEAESPVTTAAEVQTTLFSTGEMSDGARAADISTTSHRYTLLTTGEESARLAAQLAELSEFCFDTETTSLDARNTQLVGIAFSWEKETGTFLWLPPEREMALKLLEPLRPLFESESIRKTGQNLKFDIQVLKSYDIDVRGALFDTMIAHYLLEPDMRHNMDLLASQYLAYEPLRIEELIGEKGPRQRTMREVEKERVTEYAVEDADLTWQLKEYFEPLLKRERLDELAAAIEMPLIRVLAKMERDGILLDNSALKSYAVTLREQIIVLEEQIHSLAGQEFNIASPRQLGDILFIRLRLDDNARLTKTKQYRTDEEVLQRLTGRHPIVGKVLEYRGLRKLLSTYVEALPQLTDPHTGRIHTTFNQAVASTGRLSSANPNLQNIPVRDSEGREIRKAFIPSEGKIFLSADYSQIELRLMAHLSRDQAMISDFLSGQDIHSSTASKIFGVPVAEVTREMRAKAKTANFGIIYGISAFGLSERLNIARREARELIDGYFNSYPGVREYMDQSISRAREEGFVTTMFGRKRFLSGIQSRNNLIRGNAERNAINAPIQGSAADIIKIAMVRIASRLEREIPTARMILQVHDELMFEVSEGEMTRLEVLVREEMEGAARLEVPLLVDMGKGYNWLEAH